MFKINDAVSRTFSQSGIKFRPNAGPGLWLMFLLPLSVIISSIKHLRECSYTYRLSAAISLGLLGTSIIFIIQSMRKKPLTIVRSLHLVPAACTTTVFRFLFLEGVIFSLISGLISSLLYWQLLLIIFRTFPHSFTLGEVSIAVQGLTLFLYSTMINLYQAVFYTPVKVMHIATTIIQVGLCAIGLLCVLVYYFKILRKAQLFYTTALFVITMVLLIPLHFLLQQSPLIWMFNFLLEDKYRINMLIYWLVCSAAGAAAVARQLRVAKKATPAIRKVFHIFTVAVFIPGLLYQCTLLYLASGVVLAILVILEMLAILKIPPFGNSLQEALQIYTDEKDTGHVALTPLYLLVGCALPLWIHPAPCDMSDSTGFNLLPIMSGVLSIGVGDTIAGIVGSLIGKIHWPGSVKTIEGTLGCILSQLAVIYTLTSLGIIILNSKELAVTLFAITAGSLIEAKTTQIDNIVLPFVLYIILC